MSSTQLRLFLLATLLLGLNQGILNSSFNNYLFDMFSVSAAERGALELPRELPGFALIFVTGLLTSLTMRSWGILIGIFSALGVMGMGFLSPSLSFMVVWALLWSLADHLFMPLEGSVGLALAKQGAEGRRLGQIAGIRNLAMIGGAALVATTMALLPQKYEILYGIAAFFAIAAAIAFSRMRMGTEVSTQRRFVWRKRYHRFYLLNVLFGARKQIFLTFGPWVLISEFHTQPTTIATLFLVAAALGVVFRQYFGILTDRLGERSVLSADALIFLCICMGYIFSTQVVVLYALFVLDNLMFATRIARTTYLNRIAVEKSDIPATLSLGVSIDHAVSMTMPLIGGALWSSFGYQAVFLGAALVAVANFAVSFKVESRPLVGAVSV